MQRWTETAQATRLTDRIADCRNLVQHRLLSLPTSADPPSFILEDDNSNPTWALRVYQTCRMTALLYSISVTFPVSWPASQRQQLLLVLREELSAVDQLRGEGDVGVLGVLLWSTVMGGIAAQYSRPLRQWYAA